MSETLEMTIDERRKYLHKMRIRYWQAKDRSKRGELLDEMVTVTGMHRKSVLRLIHGELERKPRRRQRGWTYGEEVAAAIRVIAHSLVQRFQAFSDRRHRPLRQRLNQRL